MYISLLPNRQACVIRSIIGIIPTIGKIKSLFQFISQPAEKDFTAAGIQVLFVSEIIGIVHQGAQSRMVEIDTVDAVFGSDAPQGIIVGVVGGIVYIQHTQEHEVNTLVPCQFENLSYVFFFPAVECLFRIGPDER